MINLERLSERLVEFGLNLAEWQMDIKSPHGGTTGEATEIEICPRDGGFKLTGLAQSETWIGIELHSL